MGLTGGIACGKSHVLRRLAGHGFQTLDLDAVARDVTVPGSPALREIAGAFGAGVLGPDGSLDRAALAALVFADAAARARLNAIVHPRVRAEEARRATDVAGRGAALLVTDAALLVEAGAHLRFDRLVVVHCDPGQQLERLRARDGLDEGAARARVLAQMPLAEKRSFAHFEVDTSGSIADTDRAADALARQLDASRVRVAPGRRGSAWTRSSAACCTGPRRDRVGSPRSPCSRPRPRRGAWRWRRSPPGSRRPPGGPGTGRRGRRRREPPRHRFRSRSPPGRCAAEAPTRRSSPRPRGRSRGSPTPTRPSAPTRAFLRSSRRRSPSTPGGRRTSGRQAESLSPLARRFGGAAPSGRLLPVVAAVRLRPHDPGGARAECARRGGDAELAAALAGLGSPFEPSPRADALRCALEAVPAAPR